MSRPTYSYRKWTIQNAAKLVAGTTVQSLPMIVVFKTALTAIGSLHLLKMLN
jgi:hypothetical protein